LLKCGLAEGTYTADPADGLRLTGAVILNAVKCLPPANKPVPEEIATCRNYLEASLAALPKLRVLVALGQIAHVAAARALGLPTSSTKFGHGAEHMAPDGRVLLSSYHCSRYNQNTRRLDAAMFESVFERAVAYRCSGLRSRKNPNAARCFFACAVSRVATRTPVSSAPNSASMSPRSSQMKLWP
jgi:uracil-DNA glycosylase